MLKVLLYSLLTITLIGCNHVPNQEKGQEKNEATISGSSPSQTDQSLSRDNFVQHIPTVPGDNFVNHHTRVLSQLAHLHGLYRLNSSFEVLGERESVPSWFEAYLSKQLDALLSNFDIKNYRPISVKLSRYGGSYSTENVIFLDINHLVNVLNHSITFLFNDFDTYIDLINVVRKEGVFFNQREYKNISDQLNSPEAKILQLDESLNASLRFLLLHEVAHIKLKHHKLTPSTCAEHRKLEDEADAFVINKLIKWKPPKGSRQINFLEGLYVSHVLRGNKDKDFIDVPFSITGVGLQELILPLHQSDTACSHRDLAKRVQIIEDLINVHFNGAEIKGKLEKNPL